MGRYLQEEDQGWNYYWLTIQPNAIFVWQNNIIFKQLPIVLSRNCILDSFKNNSCSGALACEFHKVLTIVAH